MAAFTVVVSGLSYAEFDYTFNKENKYLSKKCLVMIFWSHFLSLGPAMLLCIWSPLISFLFSLLKPHEISVGYDQSLLGRSMDFMKCSINPLTAMLAALSLKTNDKSAKFKIIKPVLNWVNFSLRT